MSRSSYTKLTPEQLRLTRNIRRWADLSDAQKRALSLLYRVEQPEWRGNQSVVPLGRNTRSEHPWNLAVHSATSRRLEEIGLVETFIADHAVCCRITAIGRIFAKQGLT